MTLHTNIYQINMMYAHWKKGLITCADSLSLGSVYKLVAKEGNDRLVPTIKVSSDSEKITTPGCKKVYHIVSKKTGKAEGNYIADMSESVHGLERIKLFDPVHTWKQKTVTDFEAMEFRLAILFLLCGTSLWRLENAV